MNQLSGKYVNVVLSVESGRGMDFLRNRVFITANFNSRMLESDYIAPEESPTFNTELVWEIEKKELRKIRCGNLPLRVECITIDSQNRKERIGFALLSLRSAQIIPQTDPQQPTHAWHKLIGCQADKRKSHPELYLSLSLRDYIVNDQIDIDCNEEMPFILEEDSPAQDELQEYPIKYFENGHIQIGNAQVAKLRYTLNLKIIDVHNLDTLLPEALVFQTNSGSYFLTFKILGIIIKTKPFQNNMYGNIVLNEKIVVNLLSTKEILGEFFKTQTISVSFYSGYDKLGVTKLNCINVWTKEDETYFFKVATTDGSVPFESSDKSPYITLQSWIDEHDANTDTFNFPSTEEIPEKPKARTIFSNVCKESSNDFDKRSTHNTEEPEIANTDRQIAPAITKSVDTVVLSEPLTARPSSVIDEYEKFVVLISLKYLIWALPPDHSKIMFKFLHPRAASCTTIFMEISNEVRKEIPLSNLYVRIAYLSTTEKISKLLKYWHPQIVLADKDEEYITHKCPLNIDCLEQRSEDYEVELTSLRDGSKLAKIGINVSLNIVNSKLEDDYENLFLLPVVLDEIITVKEVSDLTKWKEEQKSLFLRELENVKREQINRLQGEYDEKKSQLEHKLSKTFDNCRNIQEQLKKSIIRMKLDKQLTKKGNNRQHLYEDIFRTNWLCYSEDNSKEVIELLSKAQRDNKLLKEMCEEQTKELSSINKSIATKTQTNNLLQELRTIEEKFSEAQTAKSYFKERWQTACEEIYDINTEDINTLKHEIKQSNEILNTYQLQGFYTEQSLPEENRSGQL